MEPVILCRYGEIGIKGGNRVQFERRLAENIRACLASRGVPVHRIDRPYGRIIIHTDGPADGLRTVFGITSYSMAVACDTLEEAKRHAPKAYAGTGTFRVTCQRLDKDYPLQAREVGKELGLAITAATGRQADLTGYQQELEAEVLGGKVYLCTARSPGPGGLPLGMERGVAARIRTERDILAALLVMRRGCTVTPVIEGAADTGLLQAYSCGIPLETVREVPPDAIVMVTGDPEPALPADGILQLRPLAGLTEDDIKEKLHGFRTASLHA
jgi:thiamine biosynthesis protein ThiI